MKRIIYTSLLLLSVSILSSCSQSEKSESASEIITTETTAENDAKKEYTPLLIGESYTFPEEDMLNGGLKITLTDAYFDNSVQLNQEYSSDNFDGYTPIIVKAVFENTGNKYVDITCFELLDSNGEMGKWAPYIEGVSSDMPDGLSPQQKVNLIFVYGIKNNADFDLTYSGVTWSIDK